MQTNGRAGRREHSLLCLENACHLTLTAFHISGSPPGVRRGTVLPLIPNISYHSHTLHHCDNFHLACTVQRSSLAVFYDESDQFRSNVMHNLSAKNVQVALLSPRGRAMLRVSLYTLCSEKTPTFVFLHNS